MNIVMELLKELRKSGYEKDIADFYREIDDCLLDNHYYKKIEKSLTERFSWKELIKIFPEALHLRSKTKQYTKHNIPERINEVRNIPIRDIVSRHIHLNRGKGYCPFHEDETPSFSIQEKMNIFNCFGCGIKGDGIKFVMELNRWSFKQALDYLYDTYIGTTKNTLKQEVKL